jgi:hypothetical protein
MNRRAVISGIGSLWTGPACSQSGTPPAPPAHHFEAPAFPLTTAPGARYLIDAAGAPFLLHGDSPWSLIGDLSREDALVYLEDRRARGFNTILVSLLERKFSRNAPANFYRDQPFLEADDYATPNEAYFAHADWVLQQAEQRGILALLTPSYIGWLGGDHGWYPAMIANGADKLRAYGRYLAQRFAQRRNILWVHGGDDDPPDRGVVRAIAEGIREIDAASLHTVHTRAESTGLRSWPNEDWLSVNTVYVRSQIWEACADESRRPRGLPVFFIEGTYENETYGGPVPREDDLRRQAYHALLSGAFGHVFGNNPIWHFEGPGLFDAPYGWREALASRGAQSMTLVRQIMNQVDWPLLEADLDHEFLTSGLGGGEDYAAAAVTSDRRQAMVYLPTIRGIGVDLRRLAGARVVLRWIDPASGASHAIAEAAAPESGVYALAPPGRNAAGYRDWVLMAESS